MGNPFTSFKTIVVLTLYPSLLCSTDDQAIKLVTMSVDCTGLGYLRRKKRQQLSKVGANKWSWRACARLEYKISNNNKMHGDAGYTGLL